MTPRGQAHFTISDFLTIPSDALQHYFKCWSCQLASRRRIERARKRRAPGAPRSMFLAWFLPRKSPALQVSHVCLEQVVECVCVCVSFCKGPAKMLVSIWSPSKTANKGLPSNNSIVFPKLWSVGQTASQADSREPGVGLPVRQAFGASRVLVPTHQAGSLFSRGCSGTRRVCFGFFFIDTFRWAAAPKRPLCMRGFPAESCRGLSRKPAFCICGAGLLLQLNALKHCVHQPSMAI